jgi:hypothetical protein
LSYRSFEIRDIDELDDLVRNELTGNDASNSAASSSNAANVVHAKPTRPGRGKAKVSKFSSDTTD